MGPRIAVTFCFISFLQLAQPRMAEEGAVRISQARERAESRARTALVGVDRSVTDSVAAELTRLEAAGKGDIAEIRAFQGPGDKEQAIDSSVLYWQGRMDAYVQPYVQHPEDFKDVKFGDESGPADPANSSEDYRSAAKEIDRMVLEAEAALERRAGELTAERPAALGAVTAYSVRREGVKMALEAAKDEIRRQGQYSKRDADRGEATIGINRLRNQIDASKSNFEANVRDIYANNPIPDQ